MSAGEWGELLGVVVNIRDEARAALDDPEVDYEATLRYVAAESSRAVRIAREQALEQAGAA